MNQKKQKSPSIKTYFSKIFAILSPVQLFFGFSISLSAQKMVQKQIVKPVATAVVNMQMLSDLEKFSQRPPNTIMGRLSNKEEFESENIHRIKKSVGNLNLGYLQGSGANRINVVSPSPTLNYEGAPDEAQGGGASGTYNIPPDTYGAVGLDKVFVNLNNNYRILNKITGAQLSLVSMTSFWAPLGANGANPFDPRVVYDSYNNRWIVAATTNGSNAASRVVIALSRTHDPQGTYDLYAFDPDAGATLWADFPMLGFNKNWVAIGMNMFTIPGAFNTSKVLVIDYPTLRGGTATGTFFSIASEFCLHPVETYSPTENTLYIPSHWNNSPAAYNLSTITGTAAAPVYTAGTGFARPGGNWFAPSGNIAPQTCVNGTAPVFTCPGTLGGVHVGDDFVRGNAVFRNNAIWYTQTVGLPAAGPITHTAVQWTKLNTNGTFADGGRIEDPTATASNGGLWYTYPTIAVNSSSDVLVGFSKAESDGYPGSAYAFRYSTDPAGTMQDPVIYKDGIDYYEKFFGGSRNRWGDYSHTMVDPLNDASFWTIQEYARLRAIPQVETYSKWGTWWAKVDPNPCLSNVSSGLWNTAGTWGCGGVPTATKHVSIISGQNVTLDIDPLAASITVNSGGTLTISTARTLSCKLIVYGTIFFSGTGKLTLGANDVFLAGGAILTGASSSNYFVTNSTGTLTKIIPGGGSFEFPVSPNTTSYNALTIATAAGNPDEVFSVRVDGSVTPSSSNNAQCVQRTWNITEMTAGGNSATLTFKWAAAEHGGSFSGSSAFAYRHNGSAYVLASSMTAPVLASGIYSSSTVTPITAFSPWIVASSSVLPINMDYFTGIKLTNSSHKLDWKATCSGAAANFELQRSINSRDFSALNSVDADYVRCLQPFTYTDNSPLQGKNFYRVKVRDENGKVTYSNIVLLLNSKSGFEIVNIQPNPVTNSAILNLSVANKQLLKVYLTDSKGSRVMEKTIDADAGSNQNELNLSNLPGGSYLLTVVSDQNERKTIAFVKQ